MRPFSRKNKWLINRCNLKPRASTLTKVGLPPICMCCSNLFFGVSLCCPAQPEELVGHWKAGRAQTFSLWTPNLAWVYANCASVVEHPLHEANSIGVSKPGIKMVYPEPCKELGRRISATISGWDCPLLTLIYPNRF